MARALGEDTDAAAFARVLFRRSGVRTRWACVPDFSEGGEGRLFGDERPGTAARMVAFREHAPTLAAQAGRRALRSAGVAAERVTHLVVVTCTGFYAPGPDIDLIGLLGLRADVERTLIGFMGCYAAFNGVRTARRAVEADPGACALVVCVELCSLHFRADPGADNLVAHALFGDGAAAVVIEHDPDGDRALVALGDSATRVEPGTAGHMGWEIADDGFHMVLSSYVPQLVGANLAGFVAPLVAGAPDSWCVHPGGPAILDHVQAALGIDPAALESSRAVLRDVGNLSSGTVLFVLEREIARLRAGAGGLLLGFGPGLTLEGLSFVRGVRTGTEHDYDYEHEHEPARVAAAARA